ncbi:MAG: transposase [Synechococcus sp.]
MSGEEWAIINHFSPAPIFYEPPREVDLREILNAIFYILRPRCQWEIPPMTFHLTPLSIDTSANGNANGSAREYTTSYDIN